MRLQVKSDDGISRKWQLHCDENDSWDVLLRKITQAMGELPSSVSAGYPSSTPIHPYDSGVTLKSLGIRDGDTLTVKLPNSVTTARGQHSTKPSLTIRLMPDDNSCLFRAVAYVFFDKNREEATGLRQLAASSVLEDPSYNEAVLGMPPSRYANWIMDANHWGGGIELAIFSKFFNSELASIDVANGRMDVFGEGQGYTNRAYLLYSGIHYDALARSRGPEYPETEDITVFNSQDDTALMEALEIAELAKAEHRYTDLAKFSLQCDLCGMALVGEREAQSHAMQSGHDRFSEYDSTNKIKKAQME